MRQQELETNKWWPTAIHSRPCSPSLSLLLPCKGHATCFAFVLQNVWQKCSPMGPLTLGHTHGPQGSCSEMHAYFLPCRSIITAMPCCAQSRRMSSAALPAMHAWSPPLCVRLQQRGTTTSSWWRHWLKWPRVKQVSWHGEGIGSGGPGSSRSVVMVDVFAQMAQSQAGQLACCCSHCMWVWVWVCARAGGVG